MAISAGILGRDQVESKRLRNGGKLDDIQFDAWFNCKFPDVGTLGWHPLESDITRATARNPMLVATGTGCDPGIPASHFVSACLLNDGHVHCFDEFELTDAALPSLAGRMENVLAVEHGKVFGGGYNAPFHSLLDVHGVRHFDSYVDGDERDDLFAKAFRLQSQDRLHVNPSTCPTLWRACEEQTFDIKGTMDRLPQTDYIFAMMHAIRACASVPIVPTHYSPPSKWV
jgi:hypothetical protein